MIGIRQTEAVWRLRLDAAVVDTLMIGSTFSRMAIRFADQTKHITVHRCIRVHRSAFAVLFCVGCLLLTWHTVLRHQHSTESAASVSGASSSPNAVQLIVKRLVRSLSARADDDADVRAPPTSANVSLPSSPERGDIDVPVVDGSGPSTVAGYLEVDPDPSSPIRFRPYDNDGPVDLRLIVLAYDRPDSLTTCLQSLDAAEYQPTDRVSLHVWIDGPPSNASGVDADNSSSSVTSDVESRRQETIAVAHAFNFSSGSYRVHVRSTHVGVQGQWMTVWRPPSTTTTAAAPPGGSGWHVEVALILEDDISVSTVYWRWLKAAHAAYDKRTDVSGYSVSNPEMEHATGGVLEIPVNFTAIMYPIICTWGFSPHPVRWREYQDWFFDVDRSNSTFVPLVDGLVTSDWFVSEKSHGRERTLWEQWHIYYTHKYGLFTVLANPGPRAGLLAVNRHEKGLHDGQTVVGATQALCSEWSDRLDLLPVDIAKFGYDGRPV